MLLWEAGARRPEVEEALRPLDGHRTITGARIVRILTKVDKGLRRIAAGHGRQEHKARPTWFGRLEQEDQRLKKNYDRWMDIIWSLELESFILTKLTKHSVPVNLVGPQVSFPPRWVPTRGGVFIFLCVIRRHFLAAAVDPAINLSTYSPRPMEVVP